MPFVPPQSKDFHEFIVRKTIDNAPAKKENLSDLEIVARKWFELYKNRIMDAVEKAANEGSWTAVVPLTFDEYETEGFTFYQVFDGGPKIGIGYVPVFTRLCMEFAKFTIARPEDPEEVDHIRVSWNDGAAHFSDSFNFELPGSCKHVV